MLLLSTLTQILLGTLVILAVLLGATIGYFYMRARRTETEELSDSEQAAISQRDSEIAMIRKRIEEIHERQVGASDTQNAVFRQQLEEMQEHISSRGRQIEGLQGQLRNEMALRRQAMEELRGQMRELLAIVSSQQQLQAANAAQIQAPAPAPEPVAAKEEAPSAPEYVPFSQEPASAIPPMDMQPAPAPEEESFEPADPFAGQVSFDSFSSEPAEEPQPLSHTDPFAGQVTFMQSDPGPEKEAAPYSHPFDGQMPFQPAEPQPMAAPEKSPQSFPPPVNPFEQSQPAAEDISEPEPLPVVPEYAFSPVFENPFAPQQAPEEAPEAEQPKADSFTWEPVVLDFNFDDPAPETPAPQSQSFHEEPPIQQQPVPAPQPEYQPAAPETPTPPPAPVFTEEPAQSTSDGFDGVIEWTTFPDVDEPAEVTTGDGQIHPPEEPVSQAQPNPEQTEELTQLAMIDEQRQGILYSLDIYTIEDVARFSRADARRVSAAIEGTTEDEVMNEWVFAAQSILFERYQAELRRRRAQAA